ncbi:MAG: LPS export ABC transporter permease LptF [candidate division NC10 bacterium]|nr:LPS export ABC transporter permease LptF [candidate division NC10 bacterium]
MTLLDRSIFKEMAIVFGIGLMVFTFVLLTNKILRLVELIVSKGVGIWTVVQLFLYILPYSLVVTIPMSVLLAVLATFTRLSADGEILILHGAGLSLTRVARPTILLGLLGTLATLAITIWILPFSNFAFKTLVFEMARRQAAVGIQEGIFNSPFDGLILYVERLNPKASRMEGVFLVDNRSPSEQRVIVAREGRFTSDPRNYRLGLELSQGSIHLTGKEGNGRYRLLTFTDYALTLDVSRALPPPGARMLGEQELTIAELRQRSADLRGRGQNYHPPLVEIHKKLAIPFSSLLFPLVAVPLGSRLKKGGRGISLVISVAFALGYYMLIVGGEGLGDRGRLPAALAMWLPNVLVGLAGTALFARAARVPAGLEGLPWMQRPAPRPQG